LIKKINDAKLIEDCCVKILFVKLGAIGDVVQAAIALRCYQMQYPDHEVHWLTSSSLASFVRATGVATKVIEIDEKKILSGPLVPRLLKLLAFSTKLGLHGEKYDRIATAYFDWRYRLLTLFSSPKHRISFGNGKRKINLMPHRNRVYEYFRLLSGKDADININIADAGHYIGKVLLDGTIRKKSTQYLDALPKGYVVLLPGGAKNMLRTDDLRRWPVAYYKKIAEKLIDSGYAVVLAGGSGDTWVRSTFSDISHIDLIGETDLFELLHLLQQAKAVLVHDTGPLHLTALTQAPLVSLFGPTPSNAFIPIGRRDTIILKTGNKVACSPCYDGQNYANCAKARCMDELDVEQVWTSLSILLKDGR
jgi:heptosyltransferase-2